MIKESKNEVHHAEDGIDVEWIRAAGGGKSSLLPIFDTSTSSGVLLSYRLGATKMIPQVPAIQANVNIHKRIRSSTMATYFQSSITCKVRVVKISPIFMTHPLTLSWLET